MRSRRTGVRAQRKFAVGINVPSPSRSQATEQRPELTTTQPVVSSMPMSASSALDVVALNGVHTRIDPCVLLHRLEDESLTNEDQQLKPTEPLPTSCQSCCSMKRNTPQQEDLNERPELANQHTGEHRNVNTPGAVSEVTAQENIRQKNTTDECPSRYMKVAIENILLRKTFLRNRCHSCEHCDIVDLALAQLNDLDNIPTNVGPARMPEDDEVETVAGVNVASTCACNISHDTETFHITQPTRSSKSQEPTVAKRPRPQSSQTDVLYVKKKRTNASAKGVLGEAPTFRPTHDEFKDPIKYIESIVPETRKFGLFKIVPPNGFRPPCQMNSSIKFGTSNQYIGRMYRRWGPAAKHLAALKAHLISQNVSFKHPPLLAGIEVNLPKLHSVVEKMGGLNSGFSHQRWQKVAEKLHYENIVKNPGAKLESVYVKYLLPYDALTHYERKMLVKRVESLWSFRYDVMLKRASNPLSQVDRILRASSSSDSDTESIEDSDIVDSLAEMEDCVVAGRPMNLITFRKVAKSASELLLPNTSMTTEQIESAYWDVIMTGEDHVCVNAASVDTGATDIGFPGVDETDTYTSHPWNLKRISENSSNILRFLGPVVGMTVPTMHLAMTFSTSCWHRDPHGLPWIEYMHEGAERVWYGINDEQSDNFRSAVETLCPTFCQNKSVWLPSDITMIPPETLLEHNVSMCRATQKPGEFIVVCQKAYSCSIATGFAMSESVYFATTSWVSQLSRILQELKDSCEPTMFSLEQLLLSFVNDARTPIVVLTEIQAIVREIVETELENRRQLRKSGLRTSYQPKGHSSNAVAWNSRDQEECEVCRKSLYLSQGSTGLLHNKASLCSSHILEMVKNSSSRNQVETTKNMSLELMYSNYELNEMMHTLNNRLETP